MDWTGIMDSGSSQEFWKGGADDPLLVGWPTGGVISACINHKFRRVLEHPQPNPLGMASC